MKSSDALQLEQLFGETVALYLRLTADATRIHHDGDLSGPRRTLLTALAETGPQTVARLAGARSQSRQRLQPLVNGLVADGLVAAVANPAHKQSPLVVLTAKGERKVRQIRERERALLAQLEFGVSARQLRVASTALRQVRETLETQLPPLLAAHRRR